MANFNLRSLLTTGIAAVWLVNGLFCKLLNLVPRHQEIVANILGEAYAFPATKGIGFLEVLMVVWIFSRIKPRWCAFTQIVVVGAMNVMEFVLVPDLLLFGRFNLVVAFLFLAVVYLNGFILPEQKRVFSFRRSRN